MNSARILIIGVGSPHGDDQAGWLIAERLLSELDQDYVVVRGVASPLEMLDWLDGIDRLLVCDACRGLGRVGEVRHWTWPVNELVDATWSGTHDFSLPAVLQLAERLGRLPQHVSIWSVEGAIGKGGVSEVMGTISPAVAAALPRMVDGIANEVMRGKLCTNNHS